MPHQPSSRTPNAKLIDNFLDEAARILGSDNVSCDHHYGVQKGPHSQDSYWDAYSTGDKYQPGGLVCLSTMEKSSASCETRQHSQGIVVNSFLVKEYGYAIVDPGVLLDRGFGYTLNREHSRSQCGMEIVFPNSGRFRTGPGDMKDNATFPLYKGVLPPIELWPPLLILTIPKRPVLAIEP